MVLLRILGVWLMSVTILSSLMGWGQGWQGSLFAFLTIGVFTTLPALLFLCIAYGVEEAFYVKRKRIMMVATGPFFALLVPAFLILIAPNKHNGIMGAIGLLPLTMLTGLIWAASAMLLRPGFPEEPTSPDDGV